MPDTRCSAPRKTQSSCGGKPPAHSLCRCISRPPRNSSPRSTQSYHRSMDTTLLELLVCPVTRGPLTWNAKKQELCSRSARLAYPVRDGIPVLLENEARTLSDEE